MFFDTTYKTSLTKMPLGLFVGTDNRGGSFLIGAVLLSNEKLKAFEFAINALLSKSKVDPRKILTVTTDFDIQIRQAIRSALPNTNLLICRWHVRKNILAYIKNGLRGRGGRHATAVAEARQAVLQLENESEEESEPGNESDKESFETSEVAPAQSTRISTSSSTPSPLEVALKRFNEMSCTPDCETYEELKIQFLNEYGRLNAKIEGWFDREGAWAEAYVRSFPRLGSVSTQRAESQNAALKHHLGSASHLDVLVRTVNGMMISNANQLLNLNSRDASRLPVSFPTFLVELRGKVSKYLFDIFLSHDSKRSSMPKDPDAENGRVKVYFRISKVMKHVVVFWKPEDIAPVCECGESMSNMYPCWHEYVAVTSRLPSFPLSFIHKRWLVTERLDVIRHHTFINESQPSEPFYSFPHID